MTRKPVELGPVLAEREYILKPDGVVTIRLGQPFAPPEFPNESWCPFQIEGLGSGRVRRAIGIDHFQSISLAMTSIGTTLYTSDEYQAGRLRLGDGGGDADLALPVFDDYRHLVPPIPPKPE